MSDEYGAYLYHFDANKQIDGQLTLPDALVTHNAAGAVDFVVGQVSGTPLNGRRINQGMEGLALSPDGSKLFGLLQSATLQDSGAGNVGRSNTRLVVYDVTGSDTPNNPVAQYEIKLPRIDDNGATGGVTAMAVARPVRRCSSPCCWLISPRRPTSTGSTMRPGRSPRRPATCWPRLRRSRGPKRSTCWASSISTSASWNSLASTSVLHRVT